MTISRKEPQRRALAAKIKAFMASKGWNQSELARTIGVGRDSVCTWINAQVFPSTKALHKLARVMGVPIEELAPEEFSPNPNLSEFQIRQSDDPGKAWLTINQLLPWAAVSQITGIIKGVDHE